jgi:hypothetical protein
MRALLKPAPKLRRFSAAQLDLLELVMTRIVQFLTSALALVIVATPARGLNLTADLFCATSDGVEESAAPPNRALVARGADFAMSKFDKLAVEAFGKAWRRSGNGSSPREGVVLILRMADGGYSSREMGSTNEHKQFTFAWHPATIAIVHTHPNTSDPKPQDEDIEIADKHQVPVFTITSRGMYVYDPGTRKLSKVMSDLDWLDVSKWSKGLFARQ